MSSRTLILIVVIGAIVGSIYFLELARPRRIVSTNTTTVVPQKNSNSPNPQIKASRYSLAHELVNPNGFINSAPFTLQPLIGKKVILVDFWTYSCINCQRTIPYLNAWYQKYKDAGLEIVGVHTPEFEFEKEYQNVAAAVKKFNIQYSVAQDNDYATWSAYGNQYWPHEYLIDIDGYVVHEHIGEGGYEETENAIQQALQEKMARTALPGARSIPIGLVSPTGTYTPAAQSPETYFGAARNEYLANGTANKTGEQTLARPAALGRNELNLIGHWNFDSEFATNVEPAGILYRYAAQDVYLVASAPSPVRVEVLRDGGPLTTDTAGDDIVMENGKSYVTIKEDRLYKLIKEPSGASEHRLELIIESPGLKAYTFTFG